MVGSSAMSSGQWRPVSVGAPAALERRHPGAAPASLAADRVQIAAPASGDSLSSAPPWQMRYAQRKSPEGVLPRASPASQSFPSQLPAALPRSSAPSLDSAGKGSATSSTRSSCRGESSLGSIREEPGMLQDQRNQRRAEQDPSSEQAPPQAAPTKSSASSSSGRS